MLSHAIPNGLSSLRTMIWCIAERLRQGLFVRCSVKFFDFKSTATNVRKWDRTSVPTGHIWMQNGLNLQPKFRLSVRIRIKGETILGPISVCIRTGHPRAYTRVLLYCTLLIDSSNMWLFHVFEKSQKIGKIEKKLFPRSEKNGCDVWWPNQLKWYSNSGHVKTNHRD